MYLVNFSNQHAAGPKNIALNFFTIASNSEEKFIFLLPDLEEFRALKYKDNIRVHFIKKRFGIISAIFNAGFINSVFIPKILKSNTIFSVLAFGSFLSFSTGSKKIVLLHHPYLVDEGLYQALPFIAKRIEWLKRLLFTKTVKNVDVIALQSKYMQDCFAMRYPKEKNKTIIIPNPLSSALSKIKNTDFELDKVAGGKFKILYVSRFYPHKNHEFILEVSALLKQKNFEHEFSLTIDSALPGAESFLQNSELVGNIRNLGELPQEELQTFYKQTNLFIFPSKSETFGNPIIEAMFFSCPLVLPDLGYARALADKTAEFYDPKSALACAQAIIDIANDPIKLKTMQKNSFEVGKSQLSVEDWFDLYAAQLKEPK
jgi:glycosyltransferase involved in cell wall biosynthesis